MINKSKYKKEEINNIIININNFINMHLLVYNKALKKILCKSSIDKKTIDDYRKLKNCNFNNFIKGFIKDEEHNEYKELIKTHLNFHELIAEVLIKYATNQPITEQLFNNLYFNHNRLLNLLNAMINQFEFAKNQIDKLTGAWNREIFLEFLDNEHKKSLRSNEKFSIVFSDIDFFKTVNDTYGHETGDYILHEFIKSIKIDLRDYDSVGRWGGEEFLILLPRTKIEEAVQIITRIKDNIENKDFVYDGQLIKITASFGITEFSKKNTSLEMINTSDKLMYKAKQNGRNRIEIEN